MELYIDPAGVRAGWRHADDASAELRSAARRTGEAAGSDLGPLADCLAAAAQRVGGTLEVGLAVVAEHGSNIEACLAEYARTDHHSAGGFDGLR